MANLSDPRTWFGGGGTITSIERPGTVTPPTLAAPPNLADEFLLGRMYARKQQLASLRGRASTFLTGPRGIGAGLPTSDIALAFLRAGLEEPPAPYTTSTTTDEVRAAFERRAEALPSLSPSWRRTVPVGR